MPTTGVCEGNTLRRCDRDYVLELDCATLGGRTDGRCIDVGAERTCGVALGASCRVAVDHGDHQHINYQFCDGDGAACLLGSSGASRCATAVGACTGATIGRCVDGALVVDCRNGQAIAFDCAAHGGRCDETRSACVDVQVEQSCDRSSRFCADGLRCQLPSRGTGLCVVDDG